MKRAVPLLLALACASAPKTSPETASARSETPPRQAAAQPPAAPPQGPAAAPAQGAFGLDLAGVDRSIAPGDDFFLFANGTWVKNTEIPPDRSNWGTGSILRELTAKRTAQIIDQVSKAPASDEARKIGDYYASFMDEAGIEAKGIAPLQTKLAAIAHIDGKKALARALGATLRADVDVLNNTRISTGNLFGLWVAQDLDDPSIYSPFLLQGGLGLPDRDYYLDPSPRMEDIRGNYRAYIARILELVGTADAASKAQRIFDLELSMAKSHASRLETEEVLKGNNHWKTRDFTARAKGLDWKAFFDGARLSSQQSFVVWQPKAVTGISALVRDAPLQTWKDWLAFHSVSHLAPFLPKAFVDQHFQLYEHTLGGTPQQSERWKRAVAATDDALGEAVGKLYVDRYFPPTEKARAEEMVKNLLAAFSRRIDSLPWMAQATKEEAKAKLSALKVGVGYPDHWRDYSRFEVVRGDALGNAERASLFEYQRNLDKLRQPVDRGEWVMNAHLVNAVNLPAMNALNFPAAILQPPYFDPSRPQVMDYGAAGAIIGHEISHSFDNQGALFDSKGRLHNWWTPQDFAHFQASGEALAKQYDAYQPFPDLHVHGEQTLSENIADVAGLSAAYDAYRLSLGGNEAPAQQGLGGDQQFFLSFAQSWRTKAREPALRRQIITDGHAPGRYRADTVRNLDAWYPAFSVQAGQALYLGPDARVRVW
jgi:predicted metalloendopeptidase